LDALKLVRLPPLMVQTSGRTDLAIGLVDGPIALDHPDLATGNIRGVQQNPGRCDEPESAACRHGTFVAGILSARRGARAPAIAPGCTLIVRPVFSEARSAGEQMPTATPAELGRAIVDCVDAGARVLNLSAALVPASVRDERKLEEALDHTVRRGAIVVAAAGNQGALAGSVITRHPWVIPVAAYSRAGRPLAQSNLGRSMGRRGLGAPGESVTSLVPQGESVASGGTSIAAPFVTGAVALLWSAFPHVSAVEIKHALLLSARGQRRTVAPPLLDAWAAYEELLHRRQAPRAMP
jgi:subtilisin family serine protease